MKWFVRIGAVLVGLIVLAAAGVFVLSQARLARKYETPAETIAIPADADAIARGHHLATISGCLDCHGANLAGRVFFESPMIGRFAASNLTHGRGGLADRLTDADWVRAIRHGVRRDRTPLLVMPSDEFYHLSDADLGALIGYVKSVEPVDNEVPASSLSLVGRVATTVMKDIRILAAERIDHMGARPDSPVPSVTPQYGKYLAVKCTGCHGSTLSGGKIPGTPPEWPPALNLTPYPGAALAQWSEAEFVRTLRTGVTPRGNQIGNKYMPWKSLGQMTDDELMAVWLYLRSLAPKEYGSR